MTPPNTAQSLLAEMHASLTLPRVVCLIFLATLVHHISKGIRNYYFHPLSTFPGPRLAAISNILYSYWFLSGRQPYHILALHEKYGPVVRVAPNELSFNSAQSWKDIYGIRQGGRTFIKSEFYDGGSFADQAHSIVSERNVVEHGKMRKYLSHAFSKKSLVEQEPLIAEKVDMFVDSLGKQRNQTVNIVEWFNIMTLDIIGALAFGENFRGLESGKYCQRSRGRL